ncbi:MAG: GGDEF domain-containing protein [Candidatus Dormibacteraeota bacterium]|nr:GGDEF domain-containing protein [Candidatus Dormibacteraeota bacterium]
MAAVFWAGAAVATALSLLLERWPGPALLSLLSVSALSSVTCAGRLLAGERLPLWVLHFDLAIATVLASVLAAVGASGHIAFADLYIWIGLFAVLYFRLPAVLSHVAAAGAAYALVLAVGPRVPLPVVSWLAVFGTMTVAAGVTFMLVSFLRATAREDPLTGLANRRAFDERLDEELERSQRAGTTFSVIMSDLDNFKTVNDRGGHGAGDQVLRELAAAWRRQIRGGGDILARLGGDEFAVLSPGADALGVRRLSKRLDEALPEGVSASFGVASWDGTEKGADLLRRADQAMYLTKRRKRGGLGGGDGA